MCSTGKILQDVISSCLQGGGAGKKKSSTALTVFVFPPLLILFRSAGARWTNSPLHWLGQRKYHLRSPLFVLHIQSKPPMIYTRGEVRGIVWRQAQHCIGFECFFYFWAWLAHLDREEQKVRVPPRPRWTPQGPVDRSVFPGCIVRGEYPVYYSWMSCRRMAGNTDSDYTGRASNLGLLKQIRNKENKSINRCPNKTISLLTTSQTFFCLCRWFQQHWISCAESFFFVGWFLNVKYISQSCIWKHAPPEYSLTQAFEEPNVYYGALFFF